MSQAIVDPVELRNFAHALKRFNVDTNSNLSALYAQLMALGDTWRDQEHQSFLEEFEQTLKILSRFLELSDEFIPFLIRKAERIEEYLQSR